MKSIILAAGKGNRMKSDLSKTLHKVNGKEVIRYIVDMLREVSHDEIIIVTNDTGDIKAKLDEHYDGIQYVVQREILGTGYAVKTVQHLINDNDEVLIIFGDCPTIPAECVINMRERMDADRLDMLMATTTVNDPTGYGRIVRDHGKLSRIVEQKDATDKEKEIKEINPSLYLFNGCALKFALSKLECKNAQGEYYLTDTVGILINNGYKADALRFDDELSLESFNDRIQLAQLDKKMRRVVNERHMLNGVTIIDPDTAYIGPDVKIGMDTVIYPNTWIEGNVTIGKTCDIGPFAYIRPDTVVGDNCKIGNFVELKMAKVGDNTKVSHLAYVGDAELGRGVNFSCGAITCNYDGKHKHRTLVGDGAFIGCNSNLVAPVTVGDDAFVAAGSTITQNVPQDVLAIARERQCIVENWKRPYER